MDASATGARQARLRYLTLGSQGETSVVAVQLLTGRKHQIRLQFAERDHALLGDRKYGSRRSFASGVALHSWRLEITHPTRREPMAFEAAPPASWKPMRNIVGDQAETRRRIAEAFGLSMDDPT